jgi:hypothetical protein
MPDIILPATTDRIRVHTNPGINRRIREKTVFDAAQYVNRDIEAINERIRELDQEWDIERLMGTCISIIVLAGLTLGYVVNLYWLLISAGASVFLLSHALIGWSPLLPIIRRLDFRTASEIYEEKTALRILRGDFDHINYYPKQAGARMAH